MFKAMIALFAVLALVVVASAQYYGGYGYGYPSSYGYGGYSSYYGGYPYSYGRGYGSYGGLYYK